MSKKIDNIIIRKFKNDFEKIYISNSLSDLFTLITKANKYIDQTEPWILSKSEENHEKLKSVMYHLVENLRIFAIYINPFIPDTSKNILDQLGIKEQYRTLESAMYGACDRTKVIEKGIPLFQRLDVEETTNEIKEMMK